GRRAENGEPPGRKKAEARGGGVRGGPASNRGGGAGPPQKTRRRPAGAADSRGVDSRCVGYLLGPEQRSGSNTFEDVNELPEGATGGIGRAPAVLRGRPGRAGTRYVHDDEPSRRRTGFRLGDSVVAPAKPPRSPPREQAGLL